MQQPSLLLEADGAEYLAHAVALKEIDALIALLDQFDQGQPGVRVYSSPGLADWLDATGLISIVLERLNEPAKPVRAILFDKRSDSNWSINWHQDRTIAVRERLNVPGFGPWGRKSGIAHVEPPFSVIARMITMRIHLDPVGADNAPLLVALGSHRFGRIDEADIQSVVACSRRLVCVADAGDVWLYRTPILHASERSKAKTRRRVLQVDFSAETLPAPLAWQGIA